MPTTEAIDALLRIAINQLTRTFKASFDDSVSFELVECEFPTGTWELRIKAGGKESALTKAEHPGKILLLIEGIDSGVKCHAMFGKKWNQKIADDVELDAAMECEDEWID